MFGGFQSGWGSNFSQLSDLTGNLQKLKVGLEAGLQDSGLLGPGEVPVSTATAQKPEISGGDIGSAHGRSSGAKVTEDHAKQTEPPRASGNLRSAPSEGTQTPDSKQRQGLSAGQYHSREQKNASHAKEAQPAILQYSSAQEDSLKMPDAHEEMIESSGWDDQEMDLLVPEAENETGSPSVPTSVQEKSSDAADEPGIVELQSTGPPPGMSPAEKVIQNEPGLTTTAAPEQAVQSFESSSSPQARASDGARIDMLESQGEMQDPMNATISEGSAADIVLRQDRQNGAFNARERAETETAKVEDQIDTGDRDQPGKQSDVSNAEGVSNEQHGSLDPTIATGNELQRSDHAHSSSTPANDKKESQASLSYKDAVLQNDSRVSAADGEILPQPENGLATRKALHIGGSLQVPETDADVTPQSGEIPDLAAQHDTQSNSAKRETSREVESSSADNTLLSSSLHHGSGGSHADMPQNAGNEKEQGLLSADSATNGVSAAPESLSLLADEGEDIDSLDKSALCALVREMKGTLRAREAQLETKFREVTSMQEVTQQLMARNEELARKASKTSEEDVKQLTDEFEKRVGAAERKVYALSKERDILKRNAEKLTSATDLVKEKDNIIAQVMAEGETLSKKQLGLESTIKKLRQQVKEAEMSRKELHTEKIMLKQQLDASTEAKKRLEEELSAAKAAHKSELQSEVDHYQDLLTKARASQLEAEEKAAVSAKEGLSKKAREAEQRADLLQDQILELQMGLERHRAAADAREDRLNKEIADMERRSQEAQSRHDELSGNLPDATRPLLRQIEGMQRTAQAHADAWRATEENLQQRLADSEAQSAAAGEKVRLAVEQAQSATRRANAASAALDSLREEYDSLQARYDAQEEDLRSAKSREQKLTAQISELRQRISRLDGDLRDSERQYLKRLEAELQGSRQAVSAAESRASALEDRLSNSAPTISTPTSQPKLSGPPAMAGPGHKWVLVKNGEEPDTQEPKENGYTRSAKVGPQFLGTATEVETLRDTLEQQEEQLASCQATIRQLEATRDSLSEELVALSQAANQHSSVLSKLEQTQEAYQEAETRLLACTELLGEREERIIELSADIEDMKVLYRDQIEFVLSRVSLPPSPAAASSVHSWTGRSEP